METVVYYLLLGFLYPLALLPLRALYLLADVIYFLIYQVVRYRRALVQRNLADSFPDLNENERKSIERRFYRNFADYIVETIKLLHISDREVERRFRFENVDILESHIAAGRSVVVYFSHCFNWEWAPSVTLHIANAGDCSFGQIYRPLRNRAFDRLMLRVRSRYGSVSIPKATALRELIVKRRQGICTVTGFMSDQKPSHGDPAVITEFLNHPTAFISGTETLARKLGMAAVYWDLSHTARGHYRIVVRPITDNASELPEHEATLTYASLLEESIRRDPADWLWTHNRWKNPVTLPHE